MEKKYEKSIQSGKKLGLARKLKGYSQEQLLDNQGFPHISTRSLGRWEQEGIPLDRVQDVANFFQLPPWAFLEDNLSLKDFQILTLNPDKEELLRSKLLNYHFPNKP